MSVVARFIAPRIAPLLTMLAFLKTLLCEKMRQIGDTAGIAPLVIVPGNDFDHTTAKSHRQKAIDDRRVRVTSEVGRNKRLFCIIEDPPHWTSGSFFEGIIDSLFAGLLAHICDKVHD